MLELEFDAFWNHYERQKKLKNEDFRTLHYYKDSSGFVLLMKTIDYWIYYCIVPIESIVSFGNFQNMPKEQVMVEFEKSFLFEAVSLKSKPNLSGSYASKSFAADSDEFFNSLPGMQKNGVVLVVKDLAAERKDAEDAIDYADFLRRKFDRWEKSILSFADRTLADEVMEKDYSLIEKTFGDFVKSLFNIINTADFRAELETVLTRVLKNGIQDAELELNIDVGFDQDFERKVLTASTRQMEGFLIDGKHWAGLKGISQELQQEIREYVQTSISAHKSLYEIKNGIKELMVSYKGGQHATGEVTEGRVMTIARTESNRLRNSSKIETYKKSGLMGEKVWSAFIDDRTCPICKSLNGQKVELNQSFFSRYNHKSYDHAPSHPSCRCAITFDLS